MNITRHGFSVGIERTGDKFFLSLKAIGTLTHEDYTKINPLIDGALQGIKEPNVNVYIDGSELDGWEIRAAWDDFKLGLKHGNEFKKIAIFGNKKWQEYATKIAGWFISGQSKYFEDSNEAITWLQNEDDISEK